MTSPELSRSMTGISDRATDLIVSIVDQGPEPSATRDVFANWRRLVSNRAMAAIIEQPVIALRRMQEDDLPTVLAVERSAYRAPWSEAIFRDCLRVQYLCMVVERDADIIGHVVLSFAVGECHILNLCVHPRLHNRGIGRRILRRVLRLARHRKADTVFLEVRASNVPAIALYQSEGFDEVGLRRGYYPAASGNPAQREDAVVMARAL